MTEPSELAAVAAAVLEHPAVQTAKEQAAVVALSGDLGAGKTTFTQTLARTLGVTEPVTSPTFVIMKGYELVDQPFDMLVHIDAYRLESSAELAVLGFAELLATPRTLMVIEWPEQVADLIAETACRLQFALTGETRTVTLQ